MKIPRLGWNATGIAHNRLDNDAGDLAGIPRKGFLDGSNVVIGQRDRVLNGFFRDARRARNAEGGDAGASLDQQGVGMTVVTTFKLEKLSRVVR